jgi:3-oxoacyl-[acyl-carrier-protein] synthase III
MIGASVDGCFFVVPVFILGDGAEAVVVPRTNHSKQAKSEREAKSERKTSKNRDLHV